MKTHTKIYTVYWLKYDGFGTYYRQRKCMIVATNEKEAEEIYRKYNKIHGNRKVYVEDTIFKKCGVLTINSFDDIIKEIKEK